MTMSGMPLSVGSMADNNPAGGDASHHTNGTTTMHRNYAAPTNLLLWPGEPAAPCVHLLIPPNVSTGRWTLQVLESTLEYLTCIIQRLPSIRNHVDTACLVQCGGGNDLLVLLNGAAIPDNVYALPKIRVTICLTDTLAPPPPPAANDNMSHQNGSGRISDLSDQFGTIQPHEILWMHFDSHVPRRHAFGSTSTAATRIYLMAKISPSLPDAAAAPISLSALQQQQQLPQQPPLHRIVRFEMDPPSSWNIVSVERIDGPPNGFARTTTAVAPAAAVAKPKAPRKQPRAPKAAVVAESGSTSLSADAAVASKPKASRKPRTPKAAAVTESAALAGSKNSTSVTAVDVDPAKATKSVEPAKTTKATGSTETLTNKNSATLPTSAVATGTTADEHKGSKPQPPKKATPSTTASKKQAPTDKPAPSTTTTQKRAPPPSSTTKPAAIDMPTTDDDATVSDDASVVQGTAEITSGATNSRADAKKSPARKRKAAAAIPAPLNVVADPDAGQEEDDDDDTTPVSGNLSNGDDTPATTPVKAPAAKKPRATKAKAKRPAPPFTFGFTKKELAELKMAMNKDDDDDEAADEAVDDDDDNHAMVQEEADDDDATDDGSIAAVEGHALPPSPPPKMSSRMPRASKSKNK
jgi:hypothetical protein